MQEYFYTLEKLETLQIKNRLENLSKLFKNKKVVLFGANSALTAISLKYDLKEYFNIIGVCDDNIKNTNIFEQNDLKMISVQNLYFSGIDVIINLKDDFSSIEKYLRKNHLIKKRVKFVNLLQKSFFETIKDFCKLTKTAYTVCRKTGNPLKILNEWITYGNKNVSVRMNYASKLFDIIQNPDKPIRVMFFAFDYKQWYLSNLYYKLRADNRFKVLPIVVLPNSLKNEDIATEETIKYFNENGIECVEGIEENTGKAVIIKALKPDLIIYQQYEYLKNDYTPSVLSEFALTCCVEPEFKIDKTPEINMFLNDRLQNSWQIFASNNEFLKTFKNSYVAGYTFFEKYSKESCSLCDELWNVPSSVENNRVVYVPSFVLNSDFNAVKFKEQQSYMYEYISTHPQYSFVIIPEADFKQKCIGSGLITLEEYENYFNKLSMLPNATVKDYSMAIDIFKSSNLLITDSLKSAINYFPSGKPVILLSNTPKIEFSELGEKIYKTFYKINSKESVEILLEDLLMAQNDYTFNQRFSILGKYNEIFNTDSSQTIFEFLKEKLIKPVVCEPESEKVENAEE